MAKQTSPKDVDNGPLDPGTQSDTDQTGNTAAEKKVATEKKVASERKPTVNKAQKKPVKRSVPRHEQLKAQLSKKSVYVYYNGRPVYTGPGSEIGYLHNGLKIGEIVYKFDLLDVKIKD